MPSKSPAQHRLMEAAAHTPGGYDGVPQSVGKEFVSADATPEICAGILLRAPGPLFLLVRNADDGQWVQPGGHVNAGETLEEAALRECTEEVGQVPSGDRWLFRESQSGNVKFTCYLQDVQPFEPTLDDESTQWRWCAPDDLPPDTHPEVARSIDLASGNELVIINAIRDGELFSPQRYENAWFFDLRITGTGTSYREALDEYVFRPPENFLTDDFVARCNGLPVIFLHPGESILDTDEYRARSIGAVVLPYIAGDEVRGIARINDADAAALMQTADFASTSPAVVFRKAGSTETIEVDGKSVLIEGNPSFLDHLAICELGVWDKGGEPSGVTNGVFKMEENEMVDGDKAPAWADAMIKRFDEMCSRMDAMEGKKREDSEKEDERKDSFDGLEKKVEDEGYDKEAAEKIAGKVAQEKKADSAEEEGEKEMSEEQKAAEAIKKAEKAGEAERKEERADAYADSIRENQAMKAKIAEMDARIKAFAQPLSASDRDELSRAQARAENVAYMFGDSVMPPLHNESPISYRKRLAAKFQKHSETAKSIKLDAMDAPTFAVIEERIYADAQTAARNPASAPAGRLIAHVSIDNAGRRITEFSGDTLECWKPFMAPGNRIRVNKPSA